MIEKGEVAEREEEEGRKVNGEGDKMAWWEMLVEEKGEGWKEMRRRKEEDGETWEERRRR